MKSWGIHMILDLKRCQPQFIRCPDRITNFSGALVKKIDMVAFGNPWVQHFGSGDKAGFTLVQLIETSNIIAHYAEHDNSAYIDVFSCKSFKEADVEAVVREYFEPEEIRSRLFLRGGNELR